MNIAIEKSSICGRINAIVSKSFAHRIAICDFLAGNTSSLDYNSDDIIATTRALTAIKKGQRIIDCGESASTLRFLLPLCAALGGEFELIGSDRLLARPNNELLSVLADNNIKAEVQKSIKISGKLTSGEFRLRGDISSQYITGLLMTLPTLDGDSEIILTTPPVSVPYIDMTIEVLSRYGIKIIRNKDGFLIAGNQKFKGTVSPEGDWSNAAFFLVLGAIAGSISVHGLDLSSTQGDKFIIEVLRRAGAVVYENENFIKVDKSPLKAFEFYAEDCPDIVPICSALAAYAQGVSNIHGISRLKIKECDRVAAIIEVLAAFGINARTKDDTMVIYGGKPTCGKATSHNDHRIAMSIAVLAAGADGKSQLIGAEAINKSYPTFFKDFRQCGGITHEI